MDEETSEGPEIKGDEKNNSTGISDDLHPGKIISVLAEKENDEKVEFEVKSHLGSNIELAHY